MNLKHLALAMFCTTALAERCNNDEDKYPQENNDCYWAGEAPWCGYTNYDIGDYEDSESHLVAWTKDYDSVALESAGVISNDCLNAYGSGCIFSGYKRLWCRHKQY